LVELKRNWEAFAQSDPFWAICVDPSKKHKRWDPREFFLTGVREISTVLAYVESLGLALDTSGIALDFGCGVGRLTQALAERFATCYGVDISPTMISLANQYNRLPTKCHYFINDRDNLSMFGDNQFNFIYSSIVLQHMESKYMDRYVREFIRVLKPEPNGILVFQVPALYRSAKGIRGYVQNLRSKLRVRTAVKNLLRPERVPIMEMHCIPEYEVIRLVNGQQARVLDIRATNSTERAFLQGELVYLKEDRREGYINRQYCVAKCA
jgi:SAM-dependent methyltransferase